MFGRKKKTSSSKLLEQLENGDITYPEAVQRVDFRRLVAQVDNVESDAKDHGNLVDLRNTWGKVILFVLILTILSDFFLVWMVGSGTWKFEGNSRFLTIVAAEHLAQILGLVLVVLKALFPKEGKE